VRTTTSTRAEEPGCSGGAALSIGAATWPT